MPNDTAAELEVNEIAESGEPLERRVEALPDLDDSTVSYLSGPKMARDTEATEANGVHRPMSPSDLPHPETEITAWAESLLPAGYRDALAVALIASGGRPGDFLALLSDSTQPPSAEERLRLRGLTPLLARALDPMRSLPAAARLVQGATAGVVLRDDGRTEPLPGLEDHPLLALDSPALSQARTAVTAGQVYTSFLWPLGGRHAPGGHARITALSGPADIPADLIGMALVSPAGDLRGLTPRELEVLGLLIEGHSNAEIARALVVAPRTVAAHLEHVLVKLSASTRTLAAVRAEREGLYVPPPPAPA